jgi:hypothetical protein
MRQSTTLSNKISLISSYLYLILFIFR